MTSSSHERQGLILSMSQLSQECENFEQESQYATRRQAFYDQTLFSFVVDEVHAMLQIMCCECRALTSFYNPIYLAFFIILYVFTLPGAALHWLLLSCVPVRCREFPEEREFRSQGVYTATGIALVSIPFCVAGLFLGDEVMVLINQVAIAVNCCIVAANMIALRAITDELLVSTRVFIVGVWLIDATLMGLTLFDVYTFVTFSWETLLDFLLRIFLVLVYTTIAVHSLQFWDMYVAERAADGGLDRSHRRKDAALAAVLVALILVVLGGFAYAVTMSEVHAWRVMLW